MARPRRRLVFDSRSLDCAARPRRGRATPLEMTSLWWFAREEKCHIACYSLLYSVIPSPNSVIPSEVEGPWVWYVRAPLLAKERSRSPDAPNRSGSKEFRRRVQRPPPGTTRE